MPSLKADIPPPGRKADPGPIARLLAALGARPNWRTLEQIADTPEFSRYIGQAHPSITPMLDGPGRRRVLQVMAASLALGGLTGCDRRQPSSGYTRLVPYVNQPQGMTPSVPLSYASATLLDGVATGVLVTTIDGRPIKIEGNPEHPYSRGGTDIFAQASVLGLYDPDRSQNLQQLSNPTDWDTLQAAVVNRFAGIRVAQGEGLRLLTGPVTSPTLLDQIAGLQKALPKMHWHVYAPTGRDTIYAGAQSAFGKKLETQWDFGKARIIASLDGDFLDAGPQQIAASRAWAAARRAAAKGGSLPTLYAVAPAPTLTYAKADDHQPIAPRDMLPFAQALLADLTGAQPSQAGTSDAGPPLAAWRTTLATALKGARGASLVVTGTFQSPEMHETVHRINAALGNIGQTVHYTDPVVGQGESLQDLIKAIQSDQVTTLIMLDTNPVYTAPADADFAALLRKVDLKLHAGLHVDETGVLADWHLPLSHPLESWGDARALDGTASIIQPTIQPLYDTRTATEVLSLLFDQPPRDAYDIVRAYWRRQTGDGDFEAAWGETLLNGFVANSAFAPQSPTLQNPTTQNPTPKAGAPTAAAGPSLLIRPDPTIRDGTWSNNSWMQELPKPMLKIVWDNVITVSPGFAARHKLNNGDVLMVGTGKPAVAGAVWVQPGQHDEAIVAYLGYGRKEAGDVGNNIGYDVNGVRRMDALWQIDGVTARKANGSRTIATLQEISNEEGHDYVRIQQVGAAPIRDDTAFTQPTLYNRAPTDGRAWGMVIDLDSCIGCNTCVVACQAENNIPSVSKEEVLRGRDMHWLRVDRYYTNDQDNPDTRFQPVPCMNCENAPCELGCPVEATLHDNEGLNLMIYNRCVGTRACSAYCPYKVRHFNYLHYSDAPDVIQEQRNPNVTVRSRGVMEKCTYCVQRIWAGRIAADKEHRPIKDGEVVTACAAACPTQAITFGDLMDKTSAVAKARQDGRNYSLLGELNTRPRTTYLAAFTPPKEQA